MHTSGPGLPPLLWTVGSVLLEAHAETEERREELEMKVASCTVVGVDEESPGTWISCGASVRLVRVSSSP